MTRICFVSGSDSTYFPMLLEWIHSIRRCPQSAGMDIGILDAGLTEVQADYLSAAGHIVRQANWPVKLPKRKIRGREFLKACVARPFIPVYFPGYDLYIWMDGDTWLQDWSAVDLLIRGAEKSGLAIVPEVDRSYPKSMRLGWFGPFPWKPRSFYYNNARRAFSGRVARALFPFASLNAGVFALRADAPHWKRWQELLRLALRRGRIFTAEQLTLGMLVRLEGMTAELLPAWCNWLGQTKPVWDAAQNRFVEPYLPHQPIGILHLSGWDRMRVDRAVTTDFKTLQGNSIMLSYRYPHLDGEISRTELSPAPQTPPPSA